MSQRGQGFALADEIQHHAAKIAEAKGSGHGKWRPMAYKFYDGIAQGKKQKGQQR